MSLGALWALLIIILVSSPRDQPLVVVFLGFGLFMIAGRVAYGAWRRRHTLYALTSRRVIVLTTTSWPASAEIDLGAVHQIATSIRRDGTGSITFFKRRSRWRWLLRVFALWRLFDESLVLDYLSDVAAVAAIVDEVRSHTPDGKAG